MWQFLNRHLERHDLLAGHSRMCGLLQGARSYDVSQMIPAEFSVGPAPSPTFRDVLRQWFAHHFASGRNWDLVHDMTCWARMEMSSG
jgi:hypothetical protein